MSKVDLSDWTPEQVDQFEQVFRALKKLAGNEPLALTPSQQSIAEQLGLMPPPSVVVEVMIEGKAYRGLLSRCEDEAYRGALYVKGQEESHE